MTSTNSIEALKGTWDLVSILDEIKYVVRWVRFIKVDSDPMDDYLRELGVGMMGRMVAKGMKPRLVISEHDGKWKLRTETTFKAMDIEFLPDVEYEEITPDGRELKVIV